MLKWSFALIQGIVIVGKMYSCCTAEKWQSAMNETMMYNKNGVCVSDGESRVSDFIYRS